MITARTLLPRSLAAALSVLGTAGVFSLLSPAAMAQQSPCGPTTTVQPGDTYYGISLRCDISVEAIRAANPGVDHRNLQIGQTLSLDPGSPPPAEPAPGPDPAPPISTQPPPEPRPVPDRGYTVQPGDTPASIAAALGITLDVLLEAYPELGDGPINIGDVIPPPFPDDPEPGTSVYNGVLTNEGVECQAMRGIDGALYTLVGDLEGYSDGGLVQVEGEVAGISICQQGTTIEVDDIRGRAG